MAADSSATRTPEPLPETLMTDEGGGQETGTDGRKNASDEPKPTRDTARSRLGFEAIAAGIGVATSLLYAVGVIVVTGFLATRGAHDLPLLSAKYVWAGGYLGVAGGMYYFFVWRKIAYRADAGIVLDKKINPILQVVLSQYFLLEFIFCSAFFSAWLVGLTAEGNYGILLQQITVVAAAIDFAIFRSVSKPLARFAISAAVLASATALYIWLAIGHPPLLAVFGISATFTLVGSYILTSDAWKDPQDRPYSLFYLGFAALVAVITFGATAYGHISPMWGGGAPVRAKPVFPAGFNSELVRAFEEAGDEVYLVADGGEYMVFRVGPDSSEEKTIRVSVDDVDGVMWERPKRRDEYAEFLTSKIEALVKPRLEPPEGSASGGR